MLTSTARSNTMSRAQTYLFVGLLTLAWSFAASEVSATTLCPADEILHRETANCSLSQCPSSTQRVIYGQRTFNVELTEGNSTGT